jgi:DGQHR domain-containing protein
MNIPALKIKQWLKEWNEVPFDSKNRHRPQPHFYVFSISAGLLKKLSKVYPRKANEKRNLEIGIQRKHDEERSEQIRDYIFRGFPYAELSKQRQESDDFSDLKMPGWLPTAIIANILSPGTKRGSKSIKADETIKIKDNGAFADIQLPKAVQNKDWDPDVPPIEIIDGQHRLWAFKRDEKLSGDFELPVVAFFDLDISWQAYLFYTINIKPKKINASLAFDLYPILRVQEWLEKSQEGAYIYKETRAQELVEVLWSHDKSPWKNRINMLGETRTGATITQAAFIRSLLASFIKTNTTRGLGGLFGSLLSDGSPLVWERTQQAAFLIFVWQLMESSVTSCKSDWSVMIRKAAKELSTDEPKNDKWDPAFSSGWSLIATDQGVRGFLHIVNDMTYIESASLNLNGVGIDDQKITEGSIDPNAINAYIKKFKVSSKLNSYLSNICDELVQFDWRSSSVPGLSEAKRRDQMVYKGSGGYKEIRSQLLQKLAASSNKQIKSAAATIQKELGYATS